MRRADSGAQNGRRRAADVLVQELSEGGRGWIAPSCPSYPSCPPYAFAFPVTRMVDACIVPPMSWYVTVTLSPAATASVIVSLEPLALPLVESPVPITFVFSSTVNVQSLPPPLTVSEEADTVFTVQIGRAH